MIENFFLANSSWFGLVLCCIFIDISLIFLRKYKNLLGSIFVQFLGLISVFFCKDFVYANLLFYGISFIFYFWALYYFLFFGTYFFSFNFLFEFYLSVALSLGLIILNFFNILVHFNLFYSILGLIIFSFLRLTFLYIVLNINVEFAEYFGSFLKRWYYIWAYCLLNLVFFFILLHFWSFDYYLVFKLCKIVDISAFGKTLFGIFSFPFLIYLCDQLVEVIFSSLFSVSSSCSSRAKTFKIAVIWCLRGLFGLLYFSLLFNLTGYSWNLGVIVGLLTLGFKGVIDDFVNGIWILIEDSVNVDEFIYVAGVSGQVIDISLRVVKLRNFDGSVYVVPFRKVEIIRNRSKDFVYVIFDIIVDLSIDSSRVITWITDSFERCNQLKSSYDFGRNILDVEVIGISSITAAGVVYQSRIKIVPYNTRLIKAFCLKCFKDLADERSIKFGFEYAIISQSKDA